MLRNRWLIRLRDEHFYKTTTPLQLRDNCQRMIVNMIIIGVMTIKFKVGPITKGKTKFQEV